jgi:hypothetical protein
MGQKTHKHTHLEKLMSHDPELIGPCILTKYMGPTNCRPSRVKASHDRDPDTKWTKTIFWDHYLSADENHLKAAEALVKSWPFGRNFKIVGRGHDYKHYYFVATTS